MTLTPRSVAVGAALLAAPRPFVRPPVLVVFVAIDQMRGDYLARYAAQWTGGFARLGAQGIVFAHGREYHATTETAPGHSTMLSGREPAHADRLEQPGGTRP